MMAPPWPLSILVSWWGGGRSRSPFEAVEKISHRWDGDGRSSRPLLTRARRDRARAFEPERVESGGRQCQGGGDNAMGFAFAMSVRARDIGSPAARLPLTLRRPPKRRDDPEPEVDPQERARPRRRD